MTFDMECMLCELEGTAGELDEVLQLQDDHQEIYGKGHLFEFQLRQ